MPRSVNIRWTVDHRAAKATGQVYAWSFTTYCYSINAWLDARMLLVVAIGTYVSCVHSMQVAIKRKIAIISISVVVYLKLIFNSFLHSCKLAYCNDKVCRQPKVSVANSDCTGCVNATCSMLLCTINRYCVACVVPLYSCLERVQFCL